MIGLDPKVLFTLLVCHALSIKYISRKPESVYRRRSPE